MEVVFIEKAKKDIDFWKNNKTVQQKIETLLEDIKRHPFTGIGKPEKLKHDLTGKWSRRINLEHRIIYVVDEVKKQIIIYSLKGHY